jgi:hypothetical protein
MNPHKTFNPLTFLIEKRQIILKLIIVCTFTSSLTGYVFAQDKLTCEEYLLPITIDWNEREPLGKMCQFTRYKDNAIYEKRKSWRQWHNERGLNICNQKLKVINFSILPSKMKYRYSPSFDLMKGDSIYVAGLSTFSFFFNDTTKQFIIITSIENPAGPPYMRDTIITNNFLKSCPYHYGSDIFRSYKNGILVLYDEYREQSVLFVDIHNEKEAILLFRYEIKYEYPEFIHKNLMVNNKDWILECEENLFVNGINIGEEKGYSKIFNYFNIDDKPFYFYEKDNLVFISYNDKTLSHKYKNVLHYGCCEPAILNPVAYSNMVCFYAQKEDENWYYVEMGVYE